MSDPKPDDPYNVQYWSQRWDENRIGFHQSNVNPNLLKYMELITGRKLTGEPVTDPELFKKNSEKSWFVPLCGKTLDIPYLLSQGFKVFGVEGVKTAIDALEEEQKLGLVYNDETKLFTGADGRLQIYVGDFFTCPLDKFGPFDYVWDRGSFIAVEYPFRSAYIDVVQKALRKSDGSWHNFSYLLATLLYNKEKFGGPPRSASDEDIQEFYGSWANFTLLSSDPVYAAHPLRASVGEGEEPAERVHLVEPKL